MEKKKRRAKSDLGENFVAPDGGWGWIICVAGGLSNLSIMPVWGSFGLIFRDRFQQIGLNSTQITTIVNTQPAILSCAGLFNGPIFRRFSFRQVAIAGAVFIVTGLFLCSLSNSFLEFFFAYSILFGFGMGISLSATFLTLNTYFKEKRRKANSFLLTISGCGPIFWPYVANALLYNYGVEGTTRIFSAIAMHAIVCGLFYQPVKWHVKKKLKIVICSQCHLQKSKYHELNDIKKSILSSETTKETILNNKTEIPIEITNDNEFCNCEKLSNSIKQKLYQKIIAFFDLDLLKDCTYLNLMIGLTFSTFSEQNFTILVPFFLHDFKFTDNQIAVAMSVMGFGELTMRFLTPFLTNKIYWDNRIFYMIGIGGMTIGRILITYVSKIEILLVIFGSMGLCRGLRTVFMGLVIPDYIQLNRLPEATGLQHLSAGLFTLACGPIIGLLKDSTDSKFILYFLSFFSFMNILMWSIDMIYKSTNKTIVNRKELH